MLLHLLSYTPGSSGRILGELRVNRDRSVSFWARLLLVGVLGTAAYFFPGALAATESAPDVLTEAACKKSSGSADIEEDDIAHYCYGTKKGDEVVLLNCAKYKLDFNKPCVFGHRPIDMAVFNLSEPMIDALVTAGAKTTFLEPISRSNLMHMAVGKCSVDFSRRMKECTRVIRRLTTLGVNINAIDRFGSTPLWLAMGQEQLVEQLIELGADFNRKRNWMTPLDYAYEMKYSRDIQVLEKHGAKRSEGLGALLMNIDKALRSLSNAHWGH